MNYQTFVATTLLVAITALPVDAHARKGKGPRHGGNPAEHLTTVLSLNETQASEVSAIFDQAHARHEQAREASEEDFCAIRNETDAQISDVLTEEQRTQFEALKKARSERRGEMNRKGNKGNRQGRGQGGEGRRPGPPDCDQ